MLSDKELRNHLTTLEFTADEISTITFTKAMINTQYHKLALRDHPDKNSNAKEKFLAEKAAKEALIKEFGEKGELKVIDPKTLEKINEYNDKVIKILDNRVQQLRRELEKKELIKSFLPKNGIFTLYEKYKQDNKKFDSQDVRFYAAQSLLTHAKEYKAFDLPINIHEIIKTKIHGEEKDTGLNLISSGLFGNEKLGEYRLASRTADTIAKIDTLYEKYKEYFSSESKSPEAQSKNLRKL